MRSAASHGRNGIVVGLCGPVGVGKTTLIPPLAEALGFLPLPERPEDNPFFARGLADPRRWAFASEVTFLLAAVEAAVQARRDTRGGVVERPLEEALGVYVPHLQQGGGLSNDEAQTVTSIAQLGKTAVGPPDVMVMLNGDPTALWRRIRSRARPGEDVYDFERLTSLLVQYESWSLGWNTCPTVTVDTTGIDLRRGKNIAALACRVRDSIE